MTTKDISGYKWSAGFFELKGRPIFLIYLLFLLLLVGAAFAWSWFGRMDVIIRADAVIRPVGDVSVVKNATSGRVIRKAFSNGDLAGQGDVLWEIDSSASTADRANAEARLTRDRGRMRGLESFSRSMDMGTDAVDATEGEAKAMAILYFSDIERLTLVLNQAADAHKKELALPEAMSSAQRRGDLDVTERTARTQLESYKAQARINLDANIDSTRREIADLEKELEDIRIAVDACVVRAPIAGRIEESRRLDVGDNLFAGEEVLRVIPERGGGLELEMKVDPRDIAEVRSGLDVVLKFPGLPPSQYGTVEGRVTRVPADSSATAAGSAYFAVEASLDRVSMENKQGQRVSLIPGMTAEARIVVKRERILRLILEKLEFIS